MPGHRNLRSVWPSLPPTQTVKFCWFLPRITRTDCFPLVLLVIVSLSFSRVQLFVTPWTEEPGRLQSMGILQARILEWLPGPPPGDLPNPGIKPRSPPFQADSLPAEPLGEAPCSPTTILISIPHSWTLACCPHWSIYSQSFHRQSLWKSAL